MKKWYESKTVWFNLVCFIVGIAAMFGFDMATFQPADEVEVLLQAAVALVPVINLFLRLVTNKGIEF